MTENNYSRLSGDRIKPLLPCNRLKDAEAKGKQEDFCKGNAPITSLIVRNRGTYIYSTPNALNTASSALW